MTGQPSTLDHSDHIEPVELTDTEKAIAVQIAGGDMEMFKMLEKNILARRATEAAEAAIKNQPEPKDTIKADFGGDRKQRLAAIEQMMKEAEI